MLTFNAPLLARYCTPPLMSYPGAFGSRRLVGDPQPLQIFTTRGGPWDFFMSGAKVSSISKGPVAFVWKAVAICCAEEPEGKAMAALLTNASSRSCLLSTLLNATLMDSSQATSRCRSSTLPGSFRDSRSLMAAEPFSTERLPRRTWLDASARSRLARAKPMPPLAIFRSQLRAYLGQGTIESSGTLPPVIRMKLFAADAIIVRSKGQRHLGFNIGATLGFQAINDTSELCI